MIVHVLKSKIHKPRVTGLDLNYEGSIQVDMDLVDAADMFPNEKVQVVNNNNGERFETYIIAGKRGSGEIRLNGACARLAALGDEIIIMSFAEMELLQAKAYQPKVALIKSGNTIASVYNIQQQD